MVTKISMVLTSKSHKSSWDWPGRWQAGPRALLRRGRWGRLICSGPHSCRRRCREKVTQLDLLIKGQINLAGPWLDLRYILKGNNIKSLLFISELFRPILSIGCSLIDRSCKVERSFCWNFLDKSTKWCLYCIEYRASESQLMDIGVIFECNF